MATEETKISVLCSLFNWMLRSKPAAKKRSKFRKFLDTFCKNGDYFPAIRLLLPNLDRERGSYGLKESVLATSLIDALGISRDSEDALRLINWRKGGAAKAGAYAGNFALVAFESKNVLNQLSSLGSEQDVWESSKPCRGYYNNRSTFLRARSSEILERRQGMASGGLTIKELNDLLDRLASNLKLGISEKSIFHEFHPDAEDLFNVTCDLKLVCEKLRDRSQRHKRQDIEVGKAVRPQLAMRVADATTAWKKLLGKEVLVECKFDGDRIQIHKNGTDIHYFSRNFLDHTEYEHGMSDIIKQNVLADRCILDGEMLVWDTSLNRFAEFGSNQEIDVAFDILYVGDTSVIHQSLKERHELLQRVVKSLKGRLEILLPDGGGLNTRRSPGEPCWSLIAHNVDDVEIFFKETIENRKVAKEVLGESRGKGPPGKETWWWIDEVQKAIRTIRTKRDLYRDLPKRKDVETFNKYKEPKKEAKRAVGKACSIYLDEVLTKDKDIRERWSSYFEKLYNDDHAIEFDDLRSTTEVIFILRMLMERYREVKTDLHIVFIDLEKAYDRVPREVLWWVLEKRGVRVRYIKVIKDMYDGVVTSVRTVGGYTTEFPIRIGLHQRSALSPYFFTIVVDEPMS
ncbi:DNA ligase 4 [Morus notabilis]|uniref:DNA ligase 4 n=1 Tax=Morus notabilis TaxID=981085 RepID=W9S888_9ROSA|nr:DNA ligase 4 [Morus notabilis]